MKRGAKPTPPSQKMLAGTYQPCRDGNRFEVIAPDTLPMEPDFLTDSGRQVWLDNIGRVAQIKTLTELDSEIFANYCNLQGCIRDAFRAGAVPPAAFMSEARKMAEQFGLFGGKSRVVSGSGEKPDNPFSKLIG